MRIQSCNHSLMSEQRKPDKRGVISYRWSMFTEIKNHLHTEVVYKCTKSETQQILEAVIMLLIILQHHTLHTKLSRAGTHFGFFIFRNKKNPGNQARIKLRLNVRRLSFAFHVTMASHLILTNRILSHSLSLLLRRNIFRLFPLLLSRTGNPVLLPYHQKSAPALWEWKASFHTLPGSFYFRSNGSGIPVDCPALLSLP